MFRTIFNIIIVAFLVCFLIFPLQVKTVDAAVSFYSTYNKTNSIAGDSTWTTTWTAPEGNIVDRLSAHIYYGSLYLYAYRNGSWVLLGSRTSQYNQSLTVTPQSTDRTFKCVITNYASSYFTGTFSVNYHYSLPDVNDMQKVIDAANNAKSSSDIAASRVWYNNNSAGYWSYNAYSKANSANTNAANAKTEATNAKNEAAAAKNYASTAASRVWDSTENKSAATLAKEARDKANTAVNNTAYIRNTQLPGIENKINNLDTKITNIQNSVGEDTTPPNVEIRTVSGARATSGSSIKLFIEATDNKSTNLEYKINDGSYQPIPADGIISAPVNSYPVSIISVKVRDEAGNETQKLLSIRKL